MNAHDGAVDQQLLEDVKVSTDVVSNGQLGRVQLCFVLIVVCKGFTRMECEGMTEDLSGVFPEERCKAGGAGVYVGHERCGGRCLRCDECQHDYEWVARGRFQEFWKERGLLVLANIRMSHDAEGPRRETVEGLQESRGTLCETF